MALNRLEAAVPDGEALRYHADLRTGGVVGLTDEYLLVVGEGVTSVELDSVVEASVQGIDWFLVILSIVLVAIGIYSTGENVLGGLGFVLAGLASLYLTYRRRGKVSIRVADRRKPVTLYPEDTDSLQAALRRVL